MQTAHQIDSAAVEVGDLLARMHALINKRAMNDDALDDGMAAFGRALAIRPDGGEADSGWAFVDYMKGDWPAAFAEYKSRWRDPTSPDTKQDLLGSEWDGADPSGKTIIVYPEQGLADTIQFCCFFRFCTGLAQPLCSARNRCSACCWKRWTMSIGWLKASSCSSILTITCR